MAVVYVSSTRSDLVQERERVFAWLSKDKHEARHSYRASGDPVVQACLRDVRESDIYLILAGQRYGTRPTADNPDRLSITELEFDEAVRLRKPIVAVFQDRPPFPLSEHAVPGNGEGVKSLQAFHDKINDRVTPDRWDTDEALISAVSVGVSEAVRKLEALRRRGEPPIIPGSTTAHPRLLKHALLLIHPDGVDEDLAVRLADELAGDGLGLRVARFRYRPEEPTDWRALDEALADCRAAAVMLTANSRFEAHGEALRGIVEFADRQCGYVAGLVTDARVREQEWPSPPKLRGRFALHDWAAAPPRTQTADLSECVAQMRAKHADLDDPKLLGLQCIVVAMTRDEAEAIRADEVGFVESLSSPQRAFYEGVVESTSRRGLDWVARYGATRQDWLPFGVDQAGPTDRSVAKIVRSVVEDINRQPHARPLAALAGHRIRVRTYAFDLGLLRTRAGSELFDAVKQRRCLVLIDELSLCQQEIRAAVADFLSGPNVIVVTVASTDPPALPFAEAVLRGMGNLVSRFEMTLDPHCELTLGADIRLRRWLRTSIPEVLAGAVSPREERLLSFVNEVEQRQTEARP